MPAEQVGETSTKKEAISYIKALKKDVKMSGRCVAALIKGGLGYE